MKISNKYRRALDVYLEWEHVKTPMSGFGATEAAIALPTLQEDTCTTAAEWLNEYESRGQALPACCEQGLLARYWRGKANRDWWTKESRRLEKSYSFQPEEFLGMLGPLPFIEIYGREPIAACVRHWYDNRYFAIDLYFDMKIRGWTAEGGRFWYLQRDDRQHWVWFLLLLAKVGWIDPTLYRLKRRIKG